MPHGQVMKLLVMAHLCNDRRQRGDQGDMEIHLLQDPDCLAILPEIKPLTNEVATL